MINLCASRLAGCCACLEETPDDCTTCMVGDTISNNLIKTERVAASKARAILDDEHTNKRLVQGNCSIHPFMKPKSLVQVTDRVHGTYIGQLSKFAVSITTGLRGEVTGRTSIEVVKVHDESVT